MTDCSLTRAFVTYHISLKLLWKVSVICIKTKLELLLFSKSILCYCFSFCSHSTSQPEAWVYELGAHFYFFKLSTGLLLWTRKPRVSRITTNCSFSQCDVKCIMTLQIKTMSYIITSITAWPIELVVILVVIMSVSTF